MNHTARARLVAPRPARLALVGLAGVLAATIGTLGHPSTSPAASSFSEPRAPEAQLAVPRSAPSSATSFSEVVPSPRSRASTESDGAVTEDDGALPDGVTVFDNGYSAIAGLEPGLVAALRDATTNAADDGIELYVNSGWRSAEYQNQLLREAVNRYGSEKEAARWVATADTSAHVSGDAVDVGGFDATAWLSEHGAEYGLCQIYRNEPWHYELRSDAIDRGCPPMYADSAHDPGRQP